jgi:circadian clock protein KaiC
LTTLRYEVTGRVARITLDRPERANAITMAMPRELAERVEEANLDPAVHVIALSGSGKGFCGGYDLVEYAEAQMATHPEFVVADGIVELLRHETGMRDERFFRVRKLRGSNYRSGLHALRLTDGGVEVYRRLVSPQEPRGYSVIRERVSTGVAGLDEMLYGGLWRGSTTLLAGPTGGGKTTIGLQFVLDGIRLGEPGLYVHLEENPTQMAHLMEGYGTDAEAPGLHRLYYSPVELQIDELVDAIARRRAQLDLGVLEVK